MENFKNESDYQSFAYTKGKSRGLNKSQLESLMNSAYIYLPYIMALKQPLDAYFFQLI